MHERNLVFGPSEELATRWRRVLEVPLDAAETFRLVLEGSHQTSTKEFTDETGVSRTSRAESRVTLLHAVGRPVGSVREWLRLPELRYSTVTMRKVADGTSSARDAGDGTDTIPVHVGADTYHCAVHPHDDGYQVGPFTVPGSTIGEPDGAVLSADIFLRHLSLPSPLVLEVVDLEPYLAGRRQLLDTWDGP